MTFTSGPSFDQYLKLIKNDNFIIFPAFRFVWLNVFLLPKIIVTKQQAISENLSMLLF